MSFSSPRWGLYVVRVDDVEQDDIFVTIDGAEGNWPVFVKAVRDDIFRLSGIGGPDGPEACWFEIELNSPSTITYYGDGVLLWVDNELS
jgi:hypothetical protein